MTKRFSYSTCLTLLVLFMACLISTPALSQEAGVSIKGVVLESGSGLPLKQVSISVAATGTSSGTDEKGEFTIMVPNKEAELIVNLPGYVKRNVFLNGRDFVSVSLVLSRYKSLDDLYNDPLGPSVIKDATFSLSGLTAPDLKLTNSSSFDQALQGRVAGLSVIQQSGMPGHKSYMNIRGISSLYGNSEPLLYIDGMIHDYSYANNSLMEGFSLNPMDVIDIDDISDITVMKDGASFMGATGSNGIINVNTEQKAETSTIIKISAYGGLTMEPNKLDVLNASQFKDYFGQLLGSEGYNQTQIDGMYPWLNGGPSAKNYYKYNNSTDWQNESFKPSAMQKFHFFLKGGDDIATYNISTGYLNQKALFKESGYSRFNLRINGKINLTDKLSITPNAKLSLANSYTPNQGYSAWKNPLLASLLKPSTMTANARDGASGTVLPYLDDIGDVFNVSSPAVLIRNATGNNVNYHFLSSVTAAYKFSDHILLSTLLGIDFNNSRETIFLPDLGVVQIDSAANSPGDFVNEFRSSQNHTTLTYNNKTASGHSIVLQGGFKYMKNSYKYNYGIDLNTPSDDFKSLGQGSKYNFLRSTTGDDRGLLWISYFTNANYSFRNKYFIDANLSYDGNSAINANNRYNFYPSVAAAWRLSSESFLNQSSWLEDLKLRASWSQTGNMFSSIYDYSKLYYTSQRMGNIGVLNREAIPNENMEIEKKNTINAGLDLSMFKQAANIHLDVYKSNVDNLVINQELPATYGFTNYFNNGGKLETTGVEVSADTRIHSGEVVWTLGGSVTKQLTKITALNFIDPNNKSIITPIQGGEYITSVGNAINEFYGYKTNGIFSSESEANQMTGPNGVPMSAGDLKYVDVNNDHVINNADKMSIGNPNPKLYGGIYTSVYYKNFELSALFNYSVGNDIYNYVRYLTESMDSYANQSTSVLNRWTTSNTNATMPRASIGDPTGNTAFSDRWIEDGSYLRLKHLTLNYTLPQVAGLYKGVTLYLTATNLLTFTKYTGYDPDFLYLNNPFYMGVDYGKIPQSRSFIVGLKLDL